MGVYTVEEIGVEDLEDNVHGRSRAACASSSQWLLSEASVKVLSYSCRSFNPSMAFELRRNALALNRKLQKPTKTSCD